MKNWSFILIFLIFITGCDALSTTNPITASQLQAQLTEIQNFVKTGSCNTAAQCKYMAIGSKACGGPSDYIVFSEDIDVTVLKKMVDRFTEDQKTYNKENNVASDCSLVTPPQNLDCIDGNCIEIK